MKKLIKISTSIILVLLIALNGMAVFALSSESTTDSGLPLADYSEVYEYYYIIRIDDPGYPKPTEDSLRRYDMARRQVVFDLDITHQAEVDMMAANLKSALDAMEYLPDYSLLFNAIYKVPSDLTKYTSESAQEVIDALKIAEDLMNYCGTNDKSQEEVNDAAYTLSDAVWHLQRRVDYSKFYDAIDKIPDDLSIYTDESLTIFLDIEFLNENVKILDQAEVDELVQNIIDSINALVPKKTELEPLLSSFTIVDKQHKWIYGLSEGVKSLDQFVNAPSGKMNYHPTEKGFGTGTKVDFLVNDKVINSYAIVIFGDISGDGVIDAFDQSSLTSITNFETQFDEDSAYQLASDINNDGAVDSFDLTILTSAVNFEMTIDQRGAANN